ADLVAGRAEVARLKNAEQESECADTAARESLAAGPQRAPLQVARERRGERNRLYDSIPNLEADAARFAAQAEEASAAVETGAAGLEDLRVQRDKAAQNAATAAEQVTQLEREHAALAAVNVPDRIAALDERRQAAATAVADA